MNLCEMMRQIPSTPFVARNFATFGDQRIEIISVEGMTGWRFATPDEQRRFNGRTPNPEQDATPKD